MSNQSRERSERLEFRGTLQVFLLLGVGCLAFALWHAWQLSRCSSWPRADATVSKLSVTYHTNFLGRRLTVSESIDFLYAYCVDGRRFESRRFFFLPGYPPAAELRGRFPEGTHFKAYYMPDDPSVAIVEPESINYAAFGFAFFFLSVWGVAAVGNRRRKFRPGAEPNGAASKSPMPGSDTNRPSKWLASAPDPWRRR